MTQGRPVDATRSHRGSRWAIARYGLGWLTAALAIAGAVTLLLTDGDGTAPRRPDPLAAAARSAGCVLRADLSSDDRRIDVAMPPTFGPPARPPRPGTYTRPIPRRQLIGALREGAVVLQYRRSLPRRALADLEAVARRDPRATILVPDATRMPYAVAATAWRRLLGCRAVDGRVLQALEGFRDRYRGRPARPTG